MSLTEKHPLPWRVGPVYEYRADVLDAAGALVMSVKPPALQRGVEQIASEVVDAMNANAIPLDALADFKPMEQGDAPPPEEPPNERPAQQQQPRHGRRRH